MTTSVIAQNDTILKTDKDEMEIIDVVEQMRNLLEDLRHYKNI